MCLGIPGQILTLEPTETLLLGRVSFGGVVKTICLSCVPEARVGDHVIVHAGFAISRIDAEEAQRALELFAEAPP